LRISLLPLSTSVGQSEFYAHASRKVDRLAISRSQFISQLQARNIGTSVHFIPIHLHPYYRDKYGYLPEDFPVAYREYLREISLPIYSTMSDDDVESVIAAVADVVAAKRR